MNRVLIFRHVPFEGAGYLETALREAGIRFDYIDLYRAGATAPDASVYSAFVFLGGPMSVNDDLPYLRREEAYIHEAIAQEKPVLGICLGAQLIAKALGARVYRNSSKEIGWFDLNFTEAGSGDALFAGLTRETVFHWHGETFDLPEGAELLACSERCRNQAYRVGTGVYGLQFHLEVTPEMIADWQVQDDNDGDMRELESRIDPQVNAERLAVLAHQVFTRWTSAVIRTTPYFGAVIH